MHDPVVVRRRAGSGDAPDGDLKDVDGRVARKVHGFHERHRGAEVLFLAEDEKGVQRVEQRDGRPPLHSDTPPSRCTHSNKQLRSARGDCVCHCVRDAGAEYAAGSQSCDALLGRQPGVLHQQLLKSPLKRMDYSEVGPDCGGPQRCDDAGLRRAAWCARSQRIAAGMQVSALYLSAPRGGQVTNTDLRP